MNIDILKKLNIKTPYLVYGEKILEQNVEKITSAIPSRYATQVKIFYAIKASYHKDLLKKIDSLNIGFEIMSNFEKDLIPSECVKKSNIMCNGIGRPEEYIKWIVDNQQFFIIDSLADAFNLSNYVSKNNKKVNTGLRFNPNLNDKSGYSSKISKLGLDIDSEELEKVLEIIQNNPLIELSLLHVHANNSERNENCYIEIINYFSSVFTFFKESGIDIDKISHLNIGGGFDTYIPSEFFKNIFNYFFTKHPNLILCLEPGRFLVNDAGYTISKVTAIKSKKDINYIYCDATTNVLIPIPNAQYKILLPSPEDKGHSCQLVDTILAPGNIICSDFKLSELPNIGDKIIIGNTGGYTSSMSAYWGAYPYEVGILDKNDNLKTILSSLDLKNAKKHLF